MELTELVPGLYVTNESRLWEVVEADDTSVNLRNVVTEACFWLPVASVNDYRIVWPESPDGVDSLL